MTQHFLVTQDMTFIEWSAQNTSIPWDDFEELIGMGAVYLNKERLSLASAPKELRTGDYIRLHTEPRKYSLPEASAETHIVFENDSFLVLEKPSGLPVHPTIDNIHDNILAWLKRDRPHADHLITHRLDAVTSGLLVIAKTKEFLSDFNRNLEARKIEKNYVCLHGGAPLPLSPLKDWMAKSPSIPKKLVSPEDPSGQLCELEILESHPLEHCVETRLRLLTGRTHQIRIQLASRGRTILGDTLYANNRYDSSLRAIALQCEELRFPWRGEEYVFKSPRRLATEWFQTPKPDRPYHPL